MPAPAVERPRSRVFIWLAGLLAAVLAIGGFAAPAYAAGGSVTVFPVSGTPSHNGTPVLTEAGEYLFQIGYGSMDDGTVATIVVPDGVSIPESALVVGAGNEGVESLALDGDGNLVITFADPFPTTVNQGVLDLRFVVDAIEGSQVIDLVWRVDDEETRQTVYVIEPGDSPQATPTGFDKTSAGVNLPHAIDADGNVVLSADLLDAVITYTVTVDSTEPRDVVLADVLSDGLAYVEGALTGSKTVRDANDVNPVTTTLTGLPAITGTSFTHSFAAEQNSRYTFSYQARIADQDALDDLRDRLQAAYDAVKDDPDGGTYSIALSNTATVDGRDDTETTYIGGSVAAAPQPDVGAAFGKSVDPAAVGVDSEYVDVATSATGDLLQPIPVTYTLTADLRAWAAFEGDRHELTRNVVVRDELPANSSWLSDDDAFLVVTDLDGGLREFAPASGLTGSIEDAIATDDYIGTYALEGKNLFLNLGRDITERYTIAVKAQIDDLRDRESGQTPLTTRFTVPNTAHFIYNNASGNAYTPHTANTAVTAPKDTSDGVTDPATFAKGAPDREVVGTVGQHIEVPFTFTVAAGTGNVTTSVITDRIDHDVLDVNAGNLAEIAEGIVVKYGDYADNTLGWSPVTQLDASHWNLELTDGGDLEFRLSEEFADELTTLSIGTDLRLTVTIPLPTHPFPAKGTLEIVNSASFTGADNEVVYLSSTSASATTYGNEMEVVKRVYDNVNDRFTGNLRADVDDNGDLLESTFVYRVELLPHGSFSNMVADVVDVLPEGLSFVGWVDPDDVAAGTTVGTDEYRIPGSDLVARYDSATDTVTVVRGQLSSGQPVTLYFKVQVDDAQVNVGITNAIGGTSATITPTDGYPLSLLKLDVTDATVVIDSDTARFDLLADDQETVVLRDLQVSEGRLVTAAGESPVVEDPGVYWVHERVAPAGYILSDELVRVTVDEVNGANAVTLYNTPAPPRTYAIGDYTWIDLDRNGIQDDGEPVLPGVTVELLRGDTVVATTTTDADGRYLFDDLAPDTYQVRFTLTGSTAADYVFTRNVATTDSVDDSDGIITADPAVARTGDIVVGPDRADAFHTDYPLQPFTATEGVDPTWDAGVVRKSVSVGDYVWVDEDRDGIQDDAEPGIPGVRLVLTGPNGEWVTDVFGNRVGHTVTGENGEYSFNDLPALPAGQSYTVTIDREDDDTVAALAPYLPTTAGVGDDRGADSSTWAATSGDLTQDGDRDPTLDFGFVTRTYAIGDVVWVDLDKDGLQGDGEFLEGVTVTLLDADGEPVDSIAPVLTDANGRYWFDELEAGTYRVQFTLTPAQAEVYGFTAQDAEGDANADSDAHPGTGRTGEIVLGGSSPLVAAADYDYNDTADIRATEGIDPTWDAGVVVKKVSVGDYVWIDVDRDGLQDETDIPLEGVVLRLLGPDGEPVIVGGVALTTATDADGWYRFADLPALRDGESYTVQIVRDDPSTVAALADLIPAAAEQGDDRAVDSSLWTAVSRDDLTADGAHDPTLDFGFVYRTYAIGDIVWVDADRDGRQGETEFLSGVTVELLQDGEIVATAQTDEHGRYLFDELRAGQYQVQFTLTDEQASVYAFTTRDAGDSDAGDSDADPTTGLTTTIVLGQSNTALTHDYEAATVRASEGIDPTWDAGVIRKKVSVGDIVWVDLDRDGIQDEGEPGIPGVRLLLTGPDGEPVTDVDGEPVAPVVTDEDGRYTFENLPALPAGLSYTVTIDRGDAGTVAALRPFLPTTPEAGDRDVDSSTWTAVSGDLTRDGDRDSTLDFGFVTKTYAIGDLVWIDSNRDGVQDDSEHVLPGVTVELLQDGVMIATTVTDGYGRYVFDELSAGEYQVRFTLTAEQRARYAFTTQDAGSADATDSDADAATGLTVTIVLGDDNGELIGDYAYREVRATQGIDPTWDAGVVLRDIGTTVPGTGGTTDPGTGGTTDSGTDAGALPDTPTVGELPDTGGDPAILYVVLLGGLLALMLGAGLVLRRRRAVC